MLLLLAADRWFTENSASMVFDWTAPVEHVGFLFAATL